MFSSPCGYETFWEGFGDNIMLLGCLPWSGLGTFYCGVGLRFGAWGQNNVGGAWVCFLALLGSGGAWFLWGLCGA